MRPESYRWPEAGAAERSQTEFAALLPLGLATPDNFLFEIRACDDGPVVGFIWLAIDRRGAVVSGFVYDLEVSTEHRRQGHATRALAALEGIARAQGATSLALHVFAFNHSAQSLYHQLGYTVASLNMRKSLAGV
jgi:ribosomal protein S18 acetylase RimI-like enzyme